MITLRHSEPYITVELWGRSFRLRRTTARRGERCRILMHSLRRAAAAHITAVEIISAKIRALEESGEATPAQIAEIDSEAAGVPTPYPGDSLTECLEDLAEHLMAIDGVSINEHAGHKPTIDDIDQMLTRPEEVVELWTEWHAAGGLTEEERGESGG